MQLTLTPATLPAHVFATLDTLLEDEAGPLAIACSGGPDSRALTRLIASYTKSRCLPTAYVFIADHGLRGESRAEAETTSRWAEGLGLKTDILTLTLAPNQSGMQERAREARYNALCEACATRGIQHLLLGHHGDDQIETFLFRLLRGSGIHGLAGMAAKRERGNLTLLRPLLDIPKTTLLDYLQSKGDAWAEDPSNANTDFARVRLRGWLAANTTLSQRARLWQLAKQCGHLRHADEVYLFQALHNTATLHDAGYAECNTTFWELPAEAAMWCLSRLLTTLNGTAETPRWQDVARLYEELKEQSRITRTLHRCLLTRRDGTLLITREAAHLPAPTPIAAGQTIRYDDRFCITASADLPENSHLAPLGETGYAHLKPAAPRTAALSLPALWHLEAPALVPHIGWASSPEWLGRLQLRFTSAKPLAEPPFYVMNDASVINRKAQA